MKYNITTSPRYWVEVSEPYKQAMYLAACGYSRIYISDATGMTRDSVSNLMRRMRESGLLPLCAKGCQSYDEITHLALTRDEVFALFDSAERRKTYTQSLVAHEAEWRKRYKALKRGNKSKKNKTETE